MEDNSPDPEVRRIIHTFKDDRIVRYFSGVSEENRYATARYATLINIAYPRTTGKYITYLVDDDRYYPMVWLSTVTQGAPIANNGIKQQVFTLTLHVVQSGSVQQDEDEDVTMYNETLAIANGLISKLYKTFDDDNNSFNQLQSGTLTQMFRTQDSVHIGWQFTITINTVWQDDCCADFE